MKVCVVGLMGPVTQLLRHGCTSSCATKKVTDDSCTSIKGCFGDLLLILLAHGCPQQLGIYFLESSVHVFVYAFGLDN